MRQRTSGGLTTSVLGFGCGSVMGRVGRGASLRAMHDAWDAGITLYDTARSYGYGEAEAVLGEFLRGRRDRAVVATKYGIAPQTQSPLKRALLPAVRAALKVSPTSVKKKLRGGDRAKQVGRFSVQGLRESLEQSLRALGTDYVDLLFLHEASAEVVQDDELMRELEALVRAGKVRRAGLYAEADVIGAAMPAVPSVLSAMQFGADPFSAHVATVASNEHKNTLLIGNHPFGSELRMMRVKAALAAVATDEAVAPGLREKLLDRGWQTTLAAVLGMALDGMGNHALVFSMMRAEHLRANVQAVENNCFSAEELRLMRQRLLNAAEH